MTKSEIRDSKKRIIRRVNEILDDYLMDEDETGAILDFQFFRGEEEQAKHLTWSKPNGKPHYKAVRLSDLVNEGVLAEPKQKTGWISVKDRLPDIDKKSEVPGWSKEVIGYHRQCGIVFCYCHISTREWILSKSCHITSKITHWMPIPEPPEVNG